MEQPLLELDQEFIVSHLEKDALQAIQQHPSTFDARLEKGLERLIANSPDEFLRQRTRPHLKRILMTQFFLQKKMEDALASQSYKPLFLKLFHFPPSQICIAFTSLTHKAVQREQVLKTFQSLLPSLQEVPLSFFTWHHPTLPFSFSYFEVHKLRGTEPSPIEFRHLEKQLLSQLLIISPLTPALFWPYNKEDSFRQVQLLQRELKNSDDLPHVSIDFQEQTLSSLEFLVHLARPKGRAHLEKDLKRLPSTFSVISQFYRTVKIPFPIELSTFSVKIPSFVFEVRESINLLYARRYVLKHLEAVIGLFRDTNGGLFEVQQRHFETIRSHLADKIPQFELFAEKLFYALHPIETWLTLSLEDAESFFFVFSSLFIDPAPTGERIKRGSFCIYKHPINSQTSSPLPTFKEKSSYAQVSFGDTLFTCFFGHTAKRKKSSLSSSDTDTVLRLYLQEGPPPSMSPHYSSGDLRCRILNKLLFEGLTRLNEMGIPELSGAESYTLASDGKVYTFRLRPTFWSNGEKVTASDYVSSWQSALSDSINHPEYLYILKGARTFKETRSGLGVQALDSSTIQVELEKPDPFFLHKLAQPYFFPLFGAMREPKWFNGPYLVRSLRKEGLLLDKNAYYWNVDRSPTEQIEIQWVQPAEPVYSLFKSGEIHWIGDPLTFLPKEHIDELQKEHRLIYRKVRRRFNLFFNTRHPALASSSIRKALSLAIDRQAICKEVFPGSVPLPSSQPQKEEAMDFFEKGLQETGFTRKTFPPLTLLYFAQTRRETLALYLETFWRETLSLPILMEGEEWNDFRSRIEEKRFEICPAIQDTLGEGTLKFYERFEGESSWNFSQWDHSGYRAMLEFAKQNPSHFNPKDFETFLATEVPLAPLFDHAHLYAVHPKLKGICIDDEGCVDFSKAYFGEL